jgi:hypothetical protein
MFCSQPETFYVRTLTRLSHIPFRTQQVYGAANPRRNRLLFIFTQKKFVKFWRISFKLITVDDTVDTNILGFMDNNFSYGIQRYLFNDHAYDKLSGNED